MAGSASTAMLVTLACRRRAAGGRVRPWLVLDGDSVRPSDTSAANTIASSAETDTRMEREGQQPWEVALPRI